VRLGAINSFKLECWVVAFVGGAECTFVPTILSTASF
jgi:hypothetical protein